VASYATSGTPSYLTTQFAKVESWARANHANPREILVGEYGVAQPTIILSATRCRQARPGSPPLSLAWIAWASRLRFGIWTAALGSPVASRARRRFVLLMECFRKR